MKIVRTKKQLKKIVGNVKGIKSIGLVPTMGCLHEGHISLVKKARKQTEFVIVSIFINPTQFSPDEDLDKYPRTEQEDICLLRSEAVDLIYIPDVSDVYEENSSVFVSEDKISLKFCGKYRPVHFRGVLTVVAKLINLTAADYIYMGQKDYQQCFLIKKMIQELDFNIKLVMCPVVRKKQGIALSSRNRYLNKDESNHADKIYQSLLAVKESILYMHKKIAVNILANTVQKDLIKMLQSIPEFKLQYAEVVSAETLMEATIDTKKLVVLIAGFFRTTRLIDNIIIKVK